MTDEDPPFICYKSRWGLRISPRTAAGWWAMALWMALLAILCLAFTWLMSRTPSGAQVAAYCVGFTLLMALWAISMILWTKARSEVVDIEELLKLKRELDARKHRN